MTHSDRASAGDTARRFRPPEPGPSQEVRLDFADRARNRLNTRHVGCNIRTYDVVDSTNACAAEWAADGAPHGAVVVAEYQTHGRGRLGRSWTAAPGLNLTFSVVLRPRMPADRVGMVTIAACTGVARAVDRFSDPVRTSIKWPNDLCLNERKMCGMLLEASWNASTSRAFREGHPPETEADGSPGSAIPPVILGIGINVNQVDFPEDIRDRTTSIMVEVGRVIPRDELFAAVLGEVEDVLDRLTDDDASVRRDYLARMMSVGERITLRFADTGRFVDGIASGIDASGGIILETKSGRRVFHAGEVTRGGALPRKHPRENN